jgi:hypothetical protein
MPGLALLSQIFCAILQRYRKMQQSGIPVPIERDPWIELSNASDSQEFSPIYCSKRDRKSTVFAIQFSFLKHGTCQTRAMMSLSWRDREL